MDILKEDHEYQQCANTILTRAIDFPEAAVQSAACSEQDPESDVDVVGTRPGGLEAGLG